MQPSEAVGLVVGLLTGFTIILAGLVWLVRQIVRQEFEKWTKPIQPGYRNGGESLADISHKLDRLTDRIEEVAGRG
ncbi:MAG: hypothetical protein ACR2JS_00130 [Candidatus Nanopelagicales bacterium]